MPTQRRIFSVLVGVILTILALRATADEYLLDGHDPDPLGGYAFSILDITISSGIVSGVLKPLLGDKTPPINVRGINSTKGVLVLTFYTSPEPMTITYDLTIDADNINWDARADAHGNSDGDMSHFYRFRRGPIGEMAKTAYSGCNVGPGYVEIVSRSGRLPSRSEIKAALPDYYDTEVYLWFDQMDQAYARHQTGSRTMPLMSALRYRNPVFGIDEDLTNALIQRLRSTGLFKTVNLPGGICGGTEVSFFAIKKTKLSPGPLTETSFVELMRRGLKEIELAKDDSGVVHPSRFESERYGALAAHPSQMFYKRTVYIASEVSRDVPGRWDTFTLAAKPQQDPALADNEYGFDVWAEDSLSVRRSDGSNSPPTLDYFVDKLNADDELAIAIKLKSLISKGLGGWCYYEDEGYEPPLHPLCKP